MLVSILEVITEILDPQRSSDADDRRALVREYMQKFARVPRFSTVLMFLTSSERNVAKKAYEFAGGNIDGWAL